MRLRIQKIKCNNICFYNDFEFDLNNGLNRIAGTQDSDGDLLYLIKLILLGYPLDPDDIEKLKPNKDGIKDGFAELFITNGEEEYGLRLHIDYVTNKSRFYVDDKKKRSVNSLSELPAKYRIDNNVLSLMIPSEEDLNLLLDETSMTAESIIEYSTGLDDIIHIKNRSLEISNREIQNYGGPSSQNKGINRQNSLLNKYKLIEMKLEGYRDEMQSSLILLKDEQIKMAGKMGLLIRKIAMSQIDEHLGNVDITAEDYDALGETIFSLKNPLFSSQQIFNSIRKLYNNLEYMKYPKNSIPMLLRGVESSNRCICGKEMDENMRGNVQRTIDRYSLQDPYLIINDVRNSIGNFKNSPLFNYYLVKSEMEATKREMTSIREKKPTKGKIVEATLFPEITTIAQTIVDLDHQIENIGYDLLCLTDAGYNDDPQSNIPACRRKIRDISLNMENADIAEEFRLKTELFGDMMDEVYRIVSKNIKDKIITSMNSKIHSFIKEGVFIEDIDGYIILNDKKINDQYKVAIEILFMNSVLELMDVDLPIVINSQHLSADLIKKIGLFIPQIIMVSGRRDLLNGGDNVAVQNV